MILSLGHAPGSCGYWLLFGSCASQSITPLARLWFSFKSITSVKNYLSGARTYLTMIRGDPTLFMGPAVATFLPGAARLPTHVPQPALPLGRLRLLDLCRKLRHLGPDGHVAAGAVLFRVASFLRQTNYLPQGSGRFSPHLIRRRDVIYHGGALYVTVRSTKTRLLGAEPVTFMLAPAPGSPDCPVAACLRAWSAVPAALTAPLFLLPSSGRPLTSPGLLALVQATLRAVGDPLAPTVTIHSLRRTGAQLALGAGAPDAEVMAHGTWTSTAYHAYVPAPASSAIPAALSTVWHKTKLPLLSRRAPVHLYFTQCLFYLFILFTPIYFIVKYRFYYK